MLKNILENSECAIYKVPGYHKFVVSQIFSVYFTISIILVQNILSQFRKKYVSLISAILQHVKISLNYKNSACLLVSVFK